MTAQPKNSAAWEVDCPPEYRLGMDGTKWRIFCCAVHFFAEYDYSSISMRKIADEVGIKAASIYNHFPSKDAILAQMYDFLEVSSADIRPDLDELMAQAETDPPREMLQRLHTYYPAPLQELLSKTILVCNKLMRVDARADAMMRQQLIDLPRRYITVLLNRMLEHGRIAPMDVEAFAELYTNNYYGASQRMYSSHPVDDAVWRRSFSMLFEIVQPT